MKHSPDQRESLPEAIQEEQLRTRLNQHADVMLVSGTVRPLTQEFQSPADQSDFPRRESGSTPKRPVRSESGSAGRPWLSMGTFGDVPAQVDALVREAVRATASDIHIEPCADGTRVRFRIDGVLQETHEVPADIAPAILSRIKVLCDLDIAEKRRPQDGSCRFRVDGRTVDVRVSTMPTDSGEKLVLRLLDQQALALDLGQLGLSPENLVVINGAISRPQGMILATGPTGSGKTTTLYAALKRIRDPKINIVTIEDPIEYSLEGINQSQIKPDIGYTFAHALRAFLRQDPNVIMVGEIRDAETAQIALRAAMTGHLVLSTVHTNDAATTITRLLDLGAEPYLVATSLSLIIAQRLVRKLCPECRVPEPDADGGRYRAVGCARCLGTGYRGRVGIYELMVVGDDVRHLIHNRASAEEIREAAIQGGMSLLVQNAQEKWLSGLTSREEIVREIGEDSPSS